MAKALVDVAQRLPVELAVAAVDVGGHRPKWLAYVLVFRTRGTGWRRHLTWYSAAAAGGICFEEMRIGLETRSEALRVIEAVDADHQRPVAEALTQALHMTRAVGCSRLRR